MQNYWENIQRFLVLTLGLGLILTILAVYPSQGVMKYHSIPVGQITAKADYENAGLNIVPLGENGAGEINKTVPNNELPSEIRAHILMYHYVRVVADPSQDPVGYRLSITPSNLEAQIKDLKSKGYKSITIKDLLQGKGGAKDIVLTFDDGYEDFYTNAFPILQKYGWTATVNIITGKIGGDYMTWPQLKSLSAAGIDIASHTVDHLALAKLTPTQQEAQIMNSKNILQNELGIKIYSICFPSGSYNATTLALVKASGYLGATTEIPGAVFSQTDPYLLPRVRVSPSLSLSGLEWQVSH
jgi:peptidoglycan/xylan/chitin deacetylase (PgdA/CDA1 family)